MNVQSYLEAHEVPSVSSPEGVSSNTWRGKSVQLVLAEDFQGASVLPPGSTGFLAKCWNTLLLLVSKRQFNSLRHSASFFFS